MNHNNIKSSRETVYFIISLIASIFVYILAAVSIIGIGIALIIFAVSLFMNAMMLGSIRGNGVRIHERQFPDVYERVQILSREMGLKKVPEVFVVQSEGALNAFATRFFGRDMVVLYSEVFELAREQGNDELDFILAHELAHIKRRHVWKNILLLPSAFIPFLAQAYSRSCEYTCDRHAAFVVRNAAASKRALTLLGIGKKLYREVNEDAYLEQIKTESNGAVWLSEILSTHPNLPKRIQSVQQFAEQGLVSYRPNTGKIAVGATLLFGSFFAVYFLSIALFAGGSQVYSQFLSEFYLDDGWEEPYGMYEGETPLMSAAYAGDIDGIEEALADGEDLQDVDSEGADALMYAVYSENTEAVQFLIDAGADVDTEDDYSTALATATAMGAYSTALLLVENGADPLAYGPDGLNALDYSDASSEQEFLTMLSEFNE